MISRGYDEEEVISVVRASPLVEALNELREQVGMLDRTVTDLEKRLDHVRRHEPLPSKGEMDGRDNKPSGSETTVRLIECRRDVVECTQRLINLANALDV